jgi:hypothetical protein
MHFPTESFRLLSVPARWDAVTIAPREPGVYLAREGASGPIIYVGFAGPRAGSGVPQGIRARLARYLSGKAITSGLGEAVADRALADAVWVRQRLVEIEVGQPRRAAEWDKAALARASLRVCWSTTDGKASAEALEAERGALLPELWNRKRFHGQ